MNALILKDILTQKRFLPLYGLYSSLFFLLFSLLGQLPDVSFIFVLSSSIIAFMATGGSFRGEGSDSERFTASLPVTRGQIVGGKYLLLALSLLYGILSTLAVIAIVGLLFPSLIEGRLELIDLLRVISGAALFSLLIPPFLRFGVKVMKIILLGFALLLGVMTQVALLMLQRDSGGMIDRILESLLHPEDPVSRSLSVLTVSLVLCLLSYLLSLLLYRGKEL